MVCYASVWLTAVIFLLVLPVPTWLASLGLSVCLLHAAWVVPLRILLRRDSSWVGLRHDEAGWALLSRGGDWRPIQLRPESLALPLAVILRFNVPGCRFAQGVCIPRGSMPRELHRQLRVRLKFSRRRWAAPE